MSLRDFRPSFEELSFIGTDLKRPESVLAFRDGSIYCSDATAIATRIDEGGGQTRVGEAQGEINGLAMDREGNLVFANWSGGSFGRMSPAGRVETILDAIGGRKIHWANFPFVDRKGALWLSISSMNPDFVDVLCRPKPDGLIVKVDDGGARIVAEGLTFANECRLDPEERFLYVAETTRQRIVRFPVTADGGLGTMEPFGPSLGEISAMPDGIAFDAEGNLWVALVFHSAIAVITPEGEVHRILDFQNVEATARLDALAKSDPAALTPDAMFACAHSRLPAPSSIAFGGPDLRTVYLGSLANSRVVTFRSPIAGAPLVHQR